MDELERTIAKLIAQKNAAIPDSTEYREAIRQLIELRYSREEAGPIIEDLDPVDWGSYCHRL
jgi:hypothetical protein